MNRVRLTILRSVALCCLLLLLAGCFAASKPTQYYLLSALAENNSNPITEEKKTISLQIDAIHFPDYLSNNFIVIRERSNSVEREEFERWAEDLDSNFERVLVENLSHLLRSSQIYGSQSRESLGEADFQLTIDLFRFEVTDKSEALLKARFRLQSQGELQAGTPVIAQYKTPVQGSSRADQILALSQALFALSKEIAERVEGT